MDRPLRLITGFALAQLLAIAVAIAVRNVGAPYVVVKLEANHGEVGVPLMLFIACLVFLTLAWSYVLTGAMHAHVVVRFVALVAFTLAMRAFLIYGYSNIWTGIAIIAAVWLVGVAITLLDFRPARRGQEDRAHTARVRIVTFVVILVLLAAFWSVGAASNPDGVGFGVYEQLFTLTFYLIPLLFIAGVDFAEWGSCWGARWRARWDGPGSPSWPLRPGLPPWQWRSSSVT